MRHPRAFAIIASRLKTPVLVVLLFLALPAQAGEKADRVVVDKGDATLSLYKGTRRLAVFPAAFGANPVGHKQQEGDERTPEGRYILDYKKANSAYHRAIHVSYPNAQDVAAAKKRGVSPGGAIMIHGQRNGFGWMSIITQRFNWTNGCIALSDAHMDVVWAAVEVGTPIEIRP